MEIGKKNFYERLGVSSTATVEEIKEAYREIARIYHPDSNYFSDLVEGLPAELSERDLQVFRMVTEAYNTLTVPDKRHAYDESLRSKALDLKNSSGSWGKAHSTQAGNRPTETERPQTPKREAKVEVRIIRREQEPQPERMKVKSVADLIQDERLKSDHKQPKKSKSSKSASINKKQTSSIRRRKIILIALCALALLSIPLVMLLR